MPVSYQTRQFRACDVLFVIFAYGDTGPFEHWAYVIQPMWAGEGQGLAMKRACWMTTFQSLGIQVDILMVQAESGWSPAWLVSLLQHWVRVVLTWMRTASLFKLLTCTKTRTPQRYNGNHGSSTASCKLCYDLCPLKENTLFSFIHPAGLLWLIYA
jgi:hypothetical protein